MFTWTLNALVENLSEFCFLQIDFEQSEQCDQNQNSKIKTVCFFSEYILLRLIPLMINAANKTINDYLINWPLIFEILFVKLTNFLKHNNYLQIASNIFNSGIKLLTIIGPCLSENYFTEISDMIAAFTDEMKC